MALQDIFPAYITVATAPPVAPAARAQRTPHAKRAILSASHVYVYVDAPAPQGPQLAFSAAYDPDSLVASRHGFAVTLSSASASASASASETLTVSRSSGCGCGSQLKSFHPPVARSLDASRAV